MVLRLIQLRIRFEDMKERANVASNINSSLETRGHVFIRYYFFVSCRTEQNLFEFTILLLKLIFFVYSYQDIKSPIHGVTTESRIYCEQCGYGIWVHLQSSQHCKDCGFSVHSVCLDNIMRGCVAQKVRTQPDFIMEICPEKPLSRYE